MTAAVLTIGAMDAKGRTGLEQDIITAAALGRVAVPIVTVLAGRARVRELPVAMVTAQIANAVAAGMVGAIKIGRLQSESMVHTVADVMEAVAPEVPLVLDCVTLDANGQRVVEGAVLRNVKIRLLPMTSLLVTGLAEGTLMSGMELAESAEMRAHGAAMMMTLGAKSVLLTGAYPDPDLFVSEEESQSFTGLLPGPARHGRMDVSLSMAIACGLAEGLPLGQAVARGHEHMGLVEPRG